MKRDWRVVGGFALAVAVAVSWIYWNIEETAMNEHAAPILNDSAPDRESPRESQPRVLSPDFETRPETPRLDAAETVLRSAQAEHEAALSALAEAERQLDDLEREVDEVERYVEDLQELGKDPARHAEEGMRRLNPVIERYEDRLELVEEADIREAAARTRLEEAQDELAALRR